MLQKNGMLPDDQFGAAYREMQEHKDEIKRKARKVREVLESGDFCLPETLKINGDKKTQA